MLVQGLAVVGDEHHQGVFFDAHGLHLHDDLIDGGIQVGHGGVILRVYVVGAGAAFGNPGTDIITEGLEVEQAFQRLVVGIVVHTLEEHVLEGSGREVGRMGIHVTHEQEPGLAFGLQALHFGDHHVVAVLGLVGAAVVMVGAPAGELQIGVVATAAGIALELDAGGVVAVLLQDFGEHLDAGSHFVIVGGVTQGHNVGAEAVLTGEHAAVAGGGGDGSREHLGEGSTVFDVSAHVGGGEALVAILAHAGAAQRVDTEEQNVRKLSHFCVLPMDRNRNCVRLKISDCPAPSEWRSCSRRIRWR